VDYGGLSRHPVRGIPVVETYQHRHEGDVLLGYIVEVRCLLPLHVVVALRGSACGDSLPGWLNHEQVWHGVV